MHVYQTKDFARIRDLPRRVPAEPSPDAPWLVALSKSNEKCQCASLGRPCCRELRPVQAIALREIHEVGGLLGPIGVGHGKTLLDLLAPLVVDGCKLAVLLLPAQLKQQLLARDVPYYSQHWRIPNLAHEQWKLPGLPTLYVISYSELSGKGGTDLLLRLRPDLIVLDEAHMVRNHTAARTKRLFTLLKKLPETKVLAWSGTLVAKSLRDWAPLAEAALHERSPAPIWRPDVEMWANALDPIPEPYGPGVLEQFCAPGESVADGYRRRVVESPGVVSSGDATSCQASLVVQASYPPLVSAVKDALQKVDATWQRPDGEELQWTFDVLRVQRTISVGFHHYWDWPRGEPKEVRSEWLDARAEWHKEVRKKLKHAKTYLDSPQRLYEAAQRYHEGSLADEQHPAWRSETWARWHEVKKTCKPDSKVTWVCEDYIDEAATWLQEHSPCVVWAEWPEFGRRIAQRCGVPYFGGGESGEGVLHVDGSQSFVASIASHGTGRDMAMYERALLTSPPTSGVMWEQVMGRLHRQGQKSDEVTFDVWQHTAPYRAALDRGSELATFISSQFGNEQKLVAVAQWVGFQEKDK